MTPRDLAALVRKGFYPDNVLACAEAFTDYAMTRPDVGHAVARVFETIHTRWDGYEGSGVPTEEVEKVMGVVGERVLRILKQVDTAPGYVATKDLEELWKAYEAIL